MMVLLALTPIVVWSMIATIELVSRDGYGAVPFDPDYDTLRPTLTR
jgi:hypothetical protein